MALDVEDGTGKATADSYASTAEADAYFQARGITLWSTVTAEDKEEALRRATDYMLRYRWKGQRVSATQALDWPRKYADAFGFDIAQTVVPVHVKNACIELAFRAASGPLLGDIKMDSTGRLPTKVIEKVGPVDEETSYATRGSMADPAPNNYPAVDLMLREYVYSGGGVYR